MSLRNACSADSRRQPAAIETNANAMANAVARPGRPIALRVLSRCISVVVHTIPGQARLPALPALRQAPIRTRPYALRGPRAYAPIDQDASAWWRSRRGTGE